MLWSVERTERLDNRRGLAVVTVLLSSELTVAIGTQVLEAKSDRHDRVLHGFDQSR